MPYSIEYFHPKVLAPIESWPVDVLADYTRLLELLMEHGPQLRLPHSRAFGQGVFELRPKGASGIGRAFYCLSALWFCMPSSRSRSRRPIMN